MSGTTLVYRRVATVLMLYLLSGASHGDVVDDLSAYVTLTTDYVWRGVSQTEEDPALQIGVDYAHDSGLFFGAWGSNVDFPTGRSGENTRDVEVDLYAGYAHQVGRRWSATVSAVRYIYPDTSDDYDYTEFGFRIDYRELLSASIEHTADYLDSGEAVTAYELGLARQLDRGFELSGTVGHYDVDELFGDSYEYGDIGVSWTHARLSLDLRYHDTSSDAGVVFGDLADNRWVFSLSVALLGQ